MKARVFFGPAAIAFGLLLLQGCVNTPYGWRIPSPMRVPQPPVERWHPPEHAAVITRPERNHSERTVALRHAKASPSVSPPVPRPTSSPTPAVTLANDKVSRERIVEVLNQTSAKLSTVDRDKLDGNNAMTYDQAEGFLRQARRAVKDKDYVAASGLAHKASVLSNKLVAPH